MAKIFPIIGLGFGDEGKGTVVDFLARKHGIDLVIKFGGPNASHHVYTNNKSHAFRQFGSATFFGAKTHLSKRMVIDPIMFLEEADSLKIKGIFNPYDLVTVSPNSLIVTPYHRFISKVKSKITKNNNTTGVGVGEAYLDCAANKPSIFVGDLFNYRVIKKSLMEIFGLKISEYLDLLNEKTINPDVIELFESFYDKNRFDYILDQYITFAHIMKDALVNDEHVFSDYTRNNKSIIMESSQGVLLDPIYGFYPYITKISPTYEYAMELLGIYKDDFEIEGIGVTRCYLTRHGSGPLVSQNRRLGLNLSSSEDNKCNEFQGMFRIGCLDLIMLDYAIQINPEISSIFLTNVDRIQQLIDMNYVEKYKFNSDIVPDGIILDEYNRVIKIDKNFANEDLTNFLFKCTPVSLVNISNLIENKDVWWKELVKIIESFVNKPVKYISFGKTYKDKIQIK